MWHVSRGASQTNLRGLAPCICSSPWRSTTATDLISLLRLVSRVVSRIEAAPYFVPASGPLSPEPAMGRRRGDTVVARFTSFGTTVTRGANESGVSGAQGANFLLAGTAAAGGGGPIRSTQPVEMTRFHARPAPVTLISPTSLEHFPPLNRAPLFFDTPGSPTPSHPLRSKVNGVGAPTGRLTDDTLDAGSDASSHKQRNGWSAVAASQKPTTEVLAAQLAAANHKCHQLQQQLDNYTKASAAAHKAVTTPTQSHKPGNAPAASKQLTDLEAEFSEYKLTSAARMSDLQQEVLGLLAAFQQQGYEVAAGLDNLQDDLIELEHAGESYQHRQARHAAAVTGDDPDTPPSTPYPPSPPDVATPASSAVSPNTEKLVVLRARREHVETAFLEMVRTSVAGLEALIQKCGQHM